MLKGRLQVAFDPRYEDYLRLSLRFAHELDANSAEAPLQAFADFGRRFAHDRDSLPQSDEDRAFHLVVLAADILDYKIPLSADDQIDELTGRAHSMLKEALALDAECHDATRMLALADCRHFDDYFRFLKEGEDAVAASCEQNRRKAIAEISDERVFLGEDIALRPYKRWLASEAAYALICGKNREAIRIGQALLAIDKHDLADVRFTLALAYAKLEDEAGLNALAARFGQESLRAPQDAWMQLARIALAYKARDISRAREQLELLIRSYPHAAFNLIRQSEIAEAVFSRLAVPSFSEDELFIAISESIVLLQEGVEESGRGVLGAWIAKTAAELDPAAERDVQ